MNKNNPVSDGYIKEESFTVFLHGKLIVFLHGELIVDISNVIAAEQFSYILKSFHVILKSDSHVPEHFCQIKIFPSHVRKSTIICLFGV